MIPVFTKYDQFKFDVRMKLEDQAKAENAKLEVEIRLKDDDVEVEQAKVDAKVESDFKEQYLGSLGGSSESPPFVLLESEGCVIHQHVLR